MDINKTMQTWYGLYTVYGIPFVDDAIALYEGGWRSSDRELLKREYNLDEETADAYILVFRRIEEDEKNAE